MLASGDDAEVIVRMFRLRPQSTASICILLSILGLLVAGLALSVVLQNRREARKRLHDEEAELRRTLARAGLSPRDEEVFSRMVESAGASSLLCATSTRAFDRGVEALLEKAGDGAERAELAGALRVLRGKLGLTRFRPGVPVDSSRSIRTDQPVVVAAPRGTLPAHGVRGRVLSAGEEAMTIRIESHAALAAVTLARGGEVEVGFSNPRDASYTFRSRVSALEEGGSALLVVPHSSSLTRVQKRGFARVEMAQEVRFRWVPKRRFPGSAGSEERLKEWIREFPAIITCVSGGGIRLRTPARLELDDFIQLVLPFLPPPLCLEPCFARVVRSRGAGAYGLSFEGINPHFQEAVIQHVRREELRQIQEERRGAAPGGPDPSPPAPSGRSAER